MSDVEHYLKIFAGAPAGMIREAIEAVESIDTAGIPEHEAKLRSIVEGLQAELTKAEGRLL